MDRYQEKAKEWREGSRGHACGHLAGASQGPHTLEGEKAGRDLLRQSTLAGAQGG